MNVAQNIMTSGLRLGTWFGIPVTANASLIPIALILLLLWIPTAGPVLAIALVLGLYASIVAHEYGHALTARRFGIQTRAITLHFFGGVAKITSEPRTPRQELLIALAGPAVSLALAALAFGALVVLQPAGVGRAAGGFLVNLAFTNLILGVFNLLPGYPMDGGRVLRALLWWRSGNHRRASYLAARGGEIVAYGLMALGVIGVVTPLPFFGLTTVLIGWFLLSLAQGERRRAELYPHTFHDPEPSHSASASMRVPPLTGRPPLARGDVEYIVRYPDGRVVTYRVRD